MRSYQENRVHLHYEHEIGFRKKLKGFRYSLICQGTSTRRQRSDLCGLRVNLPPVTTI